MSELFTQWMSVCKKEKEKFVRNNFSFFSTIFLFFSFSIQCNCIIFFSPNCTNRWCCRAWNFLFNKIIICEMKIFICAWEVEWKSLNHCWERKKILCTLKITLFSLFLIFSFSTASISLRTFYQVNARGMHAYSQQKKKVIFIVVEIFIINLLSFCHVSHVRDNCKLLLTTSKHCFSFTL